MSVPKGPSTWASGSLGLLELRLPLAIALPSIVDLLSMAQSDSGERDAIGAEEARDLRASLEGDGDAYARLVDRYQSLVAACMWRFTRNRGEWESLVQDVFVEAYYSLAKYRGRGPFAAWLRTLATRVGYRYWKQQARKRRSMELTAEEWQQVAGPGPSSTRDPKETADLVHRLLSELPPRDRLVLTLLYLEGCSVAETAERTGWSQSMVKVQAHRARGKLRRRLDKLETSK